MANLDSIPGLNELWEQTTGDPAVRVAVLDGAADPDHACFEGARLTRLPGVTPNEDVQGSAGQMTAHGSHVASVLFGQHGSPVAGVAPGCSGLLIPVFSDGTRKLRQLDLARAVDRALDAGAHVINVSGGQLTQLGEADDLLERSVRRCADSNVLLVAAAGNDGCECLHVPAALPAVLAVGALDDQGRPFDFSNWGKRYRSQGILAPGENILGAKPGGGTVRGSGTSLATPIVSGVAALLLSLQLKEGYRADPHAVRAAILEGADPCEPEKVGDGRRCLAGRLSIPGARKVFMSKSTKGGIRMSEPEMGQKGIEAQCGCQSGDRDEPAVEAAASLGGEEVHGGEAQPPGEPPNAESPAVLGPVAQLAGAGEAELAVAPSAVEPSQGGGLAYVLGTLGYDFGTEARRDSFKQLMPPVLVNMGGTEVPVPANPFDARQMVEYLSNQRSEASSLIWTLNLELTPLYAIRPFGPYGADVYDELTALLRGQVQAEGSPEYVERVSVPGVLTGATVRLFSGQVVPVLAPENTRGIYGWRINALIDAAIESVKAHTGGDIDEQQVRDTLRDFLNRLYYDLRNLGTTSPDRALNFAATNIFQAVQAFAEAIADGKVLDSLSVERSPYCRMDSDCWDVKLKFFDPENTRRARSVFRYTVDVSDKIPVTLGKVVSWTQSI